MQLQRWRRAYARWTLPSKLTLWGFALAAATALVPVVSQLSRAIRPCPSTEPWCVSARLSQPLRIDGGLVHLLVVANEGTETATNIALEMFMFENDKVTFPLGHSSLVEVSGLKSGEVGGAAIPVEASINIARLVPKESLVLQIQSVRRAWEAWNSDRNLSYRVVQGPSELDGKPVEGPSIPSIFRATFDHGFVLVGFVTVKVEESAVVVVEGPRAKSVETPPSVSRTGINEQ